MMHFSPFYKPYMRKHYSQRTHPPLNYYQNNSIPHMYRSTTTANNPNSTKNNSSNIGIKSNLDNNTNTTDSENNRQSKSFNPLKFLFSAEKGDNDCFEIMGLKLYYDDLILIGLIFLLIEEDSDDKFLLIALILLLAD